MGKKYIRDKYSPEYERCTECSRIIWWNQIVMQGNTPPYGRKLQKIFCDDFCKEEFYSNKTIKRTKIIYSKDGNLFLGKNINIKLKS